MKMRKTTDTQQIRNKEQNKKQQAEVDSKIHILKMKMNKNNPLVPYVADIDNNNNSPVIPAVSSSTSRRSQEYLSRLDVPLAALHAVCRNDENGLRSLFARETISIPTTLTYFRGLTLLHCAAAMVSTTTTTTNIIRYLVLELKFPIDCQSENGSTPLMCAAECNQYQNVKELISLGANQQLMNNEGKTYQHFISNSSILKRLKAQLHTTDCCRKEQRTRTPPPTETSIVITEKFEYFRSNRNVYSVLMVLSLIFLVWVVIMTLCGLNVSSQQTVVDDMIITCSFTGSQKISQVQLSLNNNKKSILSQIQGNLSDPFEVKNFNFLLNRFNKSSILLITVKAQDDYDGFFLLNCLGVDNNLMDPLSTFRVQTSLLTIKDWQVIGKDEMGNIISTDFEPTYSLLPSPYPFNTNAFNTDLVMLWSNKSNYSSQEFVISLISTATINESDFRNLVCLPLGNIPWIILIVIVSIMYCINYFIMDQWFRKIKSEEIAYFEFLKSLSFGNLQLETEIVRYEMKLSPNSNNTENGFELVPKELGRRSFVFNFDDCWTKLDSPNSFPYFDGLVQLCPFQKVEFVDSYTFSLYQQKYEECCKELIGSIGSSLKSSYKPDEFFQTSTVCYSGIQPWYSQFRTRIFVSLIPWFILDWLSTKLVRNLNIQGTKFVYCSPSHV